ncbi:MAG: hypothetical protein HY706_05805 [Candidatus Hydrogenedentes bacterium]|nr:hypothetical protein [Candidatus Hydrogenedentota bacterium]
MLAVLLATFAAIPIGSDLQLFVDDYLIEQLDGVRLELHHPAPQEIAIPLDKPWEGKDCAYVTVFKDGDRYRCYYRGLPDESAPEVACTAESADGIHWTKPELELYPVAGATMSNVVWVDKGAHNFAPFLDSNPGATPETKYKAVGGAPLLAFVSPDGYHWKPLQAEPILTDGKFDSHNIAFWHPVNRRYECFFRDFRDGVRTIKRSYSDDFVHWSAPEWLDFGNAPADHLYTNSIIPYFRSPGLYLGFPKRFNPTRSFCPDWPGGPGVSDGVFMTSRDGVRWHRWREAFIRPGLDPNNWNERNIQIAWGMFELSPGEISLYYLEHYRHPTCRIRRATIRTDGFVSLSADAVEGFVVTKSLEFRGNQLVLNVSTSGIGYVRCEIQDTGGNAIPGFSLQDSDEIFGDAIERVLTWGGKNDVSTLSGKPICLKFTLMDADLYAVAFRSNP